MQRAPDGTAYVLHGPREAPAVALVHGLGLTHAVWQWLAPELSQYRVLAYDLLGHGNSAAPPPHPSLRTLSEQLAGLMDHCGIDRAAVVGFSLGGMIARRLAQDRPERVAALVILGSSHRRSPQAQEAVAARVTLAEAQGPQATVEGALERWFTPAFRAGNPQMMAQVRAWVTANDPAVYPALYRVLLEGVEELVDPDPPIACPALVMTGDQDHGNGPEMTRAIAAGIAGAQALVLPGLGHMALAEDPEAVNRPILAFLERLSGHGDG